MSRKLFPVGLLFLLTLTAEDIAVAGANEAPNNEVQSIQFIADEFRTRLEIAGEVSVEVVNQDKKLVSVRRAKGRKDLFLLCFDQSFLATLSEEEIRAAIAHEFGHIWIFTHHPFLQTEDLANRTALQLVSRESLEKVYNKVAQFAGKRQDLKSDQERLALAPRVR